MQWALGAIRIALDQEMGKENPDDLKGTMRASPSLGVEVEQHPFQPIVVIRKGSCIMVEEAQTQNHTFENEKISTLRL